MRAAPLRFISAALWPLTIWTSLTHLDEHPADDYVGRTSPIVATAIAFWIGLVLFVLMRFFGGHVMEIVSDTDVIRVFREGPQTAIGVLSYLVPTLYVIGFWLYSTRDEAFPR